MKRKYKLGDMWRDDFDYDGMIEMGLKTNSSWSISDLQKLYDSMEDVNYHTPNKYLGQAIFALENDMPEVADKKFEKFHKELNEIGNEEENDTQDIVNPYLDINYKDRTSEIEALYEPTLKDIKQDPEMYAELVNDLLFHWIYSTRETPLMNMVKNKMVGKMADGGFLGVFNKSSRYNYGRSWKLDHARHNKKEDYEIPMKKRKKYDDGGMMPRKESHSDQMIDIMNKDRESGMLKKYKVKGRIITDESVHGQDEWLHDSSSEKFTINVMASSEKEAAIIAEEQMMDKHLLSDYGTWVTGKKQYYSGSVEIDKVVEISADGGETGKLVITSSYYDEHNEELQLYVDDAIYCTISFDHNPSDDEVDEIISDIEYEHNHKMAKGGGVSNTPKVIIQVEDYDGNEIESFVSRGNDIRFVQKNMPSNWGIADIDDEEDGDGIVIRVQIEGNFTNNGKVPQSEINNLKSNLQ